MWQNALSMQGSSLTECLHYSSVNRIKLNQEFHKDLKWFNTFLSVYNGVSFFQYPYTKVVHLDACTTGLVGFHDGQVYALQLPKSWHNCNIAQLEMINILVALKVWHNQWAGQRIVINCDNQAVVAVVTNGRSRDEVLAKYARNIFMWLSTCNIDMKVIHIAGKKQPYSRSSLQIFSSLYLIMFKNYSSWSIL